MTPPGTRLLLIVDSEAGARDRAGRLAEGGWHTVTASGAEGALATLGTHHGMRLDAVYLNADRAVRDPASLVRRMRERRPQLPIVVATAGRRSKLVVDVLRAGAGDYLLLPARTEWLLEALDRVMDDAVSDELRPLSEALPQRVALDRAVGSSPAFRTALAVAAKAARARSPVLIGGQPGTGRAALARAIHAAGPRAGGPFVRLDLDVQTPGDLDEVLFGLNPAGGELRHGAMVEAHGGTLFLHDIGRLPGPLQPRLAQAIDSGHVVASGSAIRHMVDVRVIASHDGALDTRAATDGFSQDLLHKLATIAIGLPPLRERTGDLPALTRDILRRVGAMTGIRPLGVTDGALSLLRRYDWPGNIRQLESVLFRAAALCNGDALTEFDLPALHALLGDAQGSARPVAGVELFADGELRPLGDIEADVIRLAINHYGGRMSEVARRLRIGRSTLYRKLAELGIDNPG